MHFARARRAHIRVYRNLVQRSRDVERTRSEEPPVEILVVMLIQIYHLHTLKVYFHIQIQVPQMVVAKFPIQPARVSVVINKCDLVEIHTVVVNMARPGSGICHICVGHFHSRVLQNGIRPAYTDVVRRAADGQVSGNAPSDFREHALEERRGAGEVEGVEFRQEVQVID